ncbi:MAG: hypothetical protein IPK19_38595 [Chloroflexi bacterium]|nr:hypothetical protein [Chloroflexota bacterium]
MSSRLATRTAVLFIVLAAFGFSVTSIQASTFHVDLSTDFHDGDLDDGVCDVYSPDFWHVDIHGCSLRAAVEQARANPGADNITLPEGTYPIGMNPVGPNPETLSIYDDELTIDGAGRDDTTLQGVGGYTVLTVLPSGTLNLNDVTIRDGGAIDKASAGGAHNAGVSTFTNVRITHNFAMIGAGIENGGWLYLYNCKIDDNHATYSGGGITESGIHARYVLLDNTEVSANTAVTSGAGLYVENADIQNGSIVQGNTAGGDGGGIYARATVNISNSTITGNSSGGSGGGVFINGATLATSGTTISNNQSGGSGGGMFVWNRAIVTLRDTTIAGNSASGYGGAIANADSTLRILNSTLGGNTATGASSSGGALDSWDFNANVLIVNSTIVNNSATITTGSGLQLDGGWLNIRNSIVAHNGPSSNNCAVTLGIFTDGGGNLDSGTSCGFGADSLSSLDPNLDALMNNGGLTQTIRLLPGSPALNAGSNVLAMDHDGLVITTDQRGSGYARIRSGTIDIGAFEAELGTLNVQISLEGHPQPPPHTSHVVSGRFWIRLLSSGEVIHTGVFTSDDSGVMTLPNLPVGEYVFRVKGSHTLAREAKLLVSASGGSTTLGGTLLEGDASDNNAVNIGDFSILAAAFATAQGQPGYDASADFNDDSVVNISDFSLLAANFGLIGDGGVLP